MQVNACALDSCSSRHPNAIIAESYTKRECQPERGLKAARKMSRLSYSRAGFSFIDIRDRVPRSVVRLAGKVFGASYGTRLTTELARIRELIRPTVLIKFVRSLVVPKSCLVVNLNFEKARLSG